MMNCIASLPLAETGFEQQGLLSCLQTFALPTLAGVFLGYLLHLFQELCGRLWEKWTERSGK